MTQDKMRRIITACVAAATVLLVFLLTFLIYQWITLGVLNSKIEKAEAEKADLLAQQEQLKEEASDAYDALFDEVYVQWKLDELEQKEDFLQGK